MADPIPMIIYRLQMRQPRGRGEVNFDDNDRGLGGVKYLTVPRGWKVTFGPICPGSKTVQLCVRVYEGKEIRSVIPDVASLTTEGVRLEDVNPAAVMAVEAPRRARRRVADRVD